MTIRNLPENLLTPEQLPLGWLPCQGMLHHVEPRRMLRICAGACYQGTVLSGVCSHYVLLQRLTHASHGWEELQRVYVTCSSGNPQPTAVQWHTELSQVLAYAYFLTQHGQ